MTATSSSTPDKLTETTLEFSKVNAELEDLKRQVSKLETRRDKLKSALLKLLGEPTNEVVSTSKPAKAAKPRKRGQSITHLLIPALIESGESGVNFEDFAAKHGGKASSLGVWKATNAKGMLELVPEAKGTYRVVPGKEEALKALVSKSDKSKATGKTVAKKSTAKKSE